MQRVSNLLRHFIRELSGWKNVVYLKVPRWQCYERTGKAPVKVRWVDVNKGDEKEPNYRSRLVAMEFPWDLRGDTYAGTPGLVLVK